MTDNVRLDFTRITERIRQIDLPPTDLVVGIATGGTVPASLLAYRLGVPLVMLGINYRDPANTPRYAAPVLLSRPHIPADKRRLLLVDDVSVTGKTLDFARTLLPPGHEVRTLVLKGRGDYVVFPEIAACVDWPWKIGSMDEKAASQGGFQVRENTGGPSHRP